MTRIIVRNDALRMRMIVGHTVKAVTLLCLIIAQPAAAGQVEASFQSLGNLDGDTEPKPGDTLMSAAHAVSADGAVVVGTGYGGENALRYGEAFRWTDGGGMVGLGDLPGGKGSETHSFALAASNDGSVVVGHSSSREARDQAFRWTSSGLAGLGFLPDDIGGSSLATDTSSGGAVVVGESGSFSAGEAFRWTQSGGMVGLGDLEGGESNSRAEGVSADGSVVVGRGTSADGGEAFRWTATDGMVGLGDLPGGDFDSTAHAISDDGTVIVGVSDSENAEFGEAFMWTESGGLVGLGDLEGGSFSSEALATSAHGVVIVGEASDEDGDAAFRYTEADGMRSLQSILVDDFGLDLTGWTLTSASGISGDGRTIVGEGINPSGAEEGWIATIPLPDGVSEEALGPVNDGGNSAGGGDSGNGGSGSNGGGGTPSTPAPAACGAAAPATLTLIMLGMGGFKFNRRRVLQ